MSSLNELTEGVHHVKLDSGEVDEGGVDQTPWAKSKTISKFPESFASWCC